MNALVYDRTAIRWRVKRATLALIGAVVCGVILILVSKSAAAAELDKAPPTQLAATQADAPGSVLEIPAPPVTVEGEAVPSEPSLEERLQRFRDELAAPQNFLHAEQRLADGRLEVLTRFGRFCASPIPAYSASSLGGELMLAARCTAF